MKRRETAAGVATIVGMAVTGATTWLFTRESSGNGNGGDGGSDSDEKGAQSTPERRGNETGNDTVGNETAPQASKEDVENESEQPEAANPEPNPEGPATNESAINESRAGSEPSVSDVVISGTELVTEQRAATVSGTATNEASEPVTIELTVTFLEDSEQIGRPALNGTTDLPPGETWDFTVSGRGSEYSAATDYEIAKSVQTRG